MKNIRTLILLSLITLIATPQAQASDYSKKLKGAGIGLVGGLGLGKTLLEIIRTGMIVHQKSNFNYKYPIIICVLIAKAGAIFGFEKVRAWLTQKLDADHDTSLLTHYGSASLMWTIGVLGGPKWSLLAILGAPLGWGDKAAAQAMQAEIDELDTNHAKLVLEHDRIFELLEKESKNNITEYEKQMDIVNQALDNKQIDQAAELQEKARNDQKARERILKDISASFNDINKRWHASREKIDALRKKLYTLKKLI